MKGPVPSGWRAMALVRVLRHPLPGEHRRERQGHDLVEDVVGLRQVDLERVGVDDLDAGGVCRLAGLERLGAHDRVVQVARRRARRHLGVEHALQRPLEVGRRDLAADRRLEHDAVAQMEGVGLAAVGDAAVGDRGHHGGDVGGHGSRSGLGGVGQELVEEAVLDRPRLDLPGHGRVEPGGLALEGDVERAARLGRGARRGAATAAATAAARRAAAARQQGDEPGRGQNQQDERPSRPVIRV